MVASPNNEKSICSMTRAVANQMTERLLISGRMHMRDLSPRVTSTPAYFEVGRGDYQKPTQTHVQKAIAYLRQMGHLAIEDGVASITPAYRSGTGAEMDY